ncbi:hypothetical protein Lal_00049474 [Lupinus albus]|uniref:Uncharacterized protein n=1 Tax=Lupinus albus TaxID=3870 RepID=A0A6A5LZU3_LUPAL|nr:hypothetical protein Lalb_Chr12g0203631 [Lupinus albus]KAF1867046.1 hypothetical protein Lal_00049474 [Lupinus albus]
MSDIAMLVAEEYGRRTKTLRKQDGAVKASEIDMVFWAASALTWEVKEKSKIVQWVLEPKSEVAVAASNNFFSA